MVDIASALVKLADSIIERGRLKKAVVLPPYTILLQTTAQSITRDYMPGRVKGYYFGVRVRNLDGGATYVAVGTWGALETRLVAPNAYQEFEAPRGSYIDASEIFINCDVPNGATVEINGVLIPEGD